MSINLPYVRGISEKLWGVSTMKTFYVHYFVKPKDRLATEIKNNIVYEIDRSKCKAVYFGECKRSLKSRSDEHKRSVKNCCETLLRSRSQLKLGSEESHITLYLECLIFRWELQDFVSMKDSADQI